jgi:hypothetical protein
MSDLIWVAIIGAIPPTLAVYLSDKKQTKKIDAVHDIANSRLTEALLKIEALSLTVERQRVAAKGRDEGS